MCFWDCFGNGIRPREDAKRIKNSVRHKCNNDEGWIATYYKRCKLTGEKKDNRDWWAFLPCCCPDSKHVAPVLDDRFCIGKDGNPLAGMTVSFHERCPMACLQFVNLWENGPFRRYPQWKQKGGFGKRNINDVVDTAIKWALAQGVGDPERPFDSNSGRKCLARWLSKFNVWFEEGMDIHGDHPDTWVKNYQPDAELKNPMFKRREQATDPDIATRALRKLVTSLEIAGQPYRPQLSKGEKMQRRMMERMGMGNDAKRICLGLDP